MSEIDDALIAEAQRLTNAALGKNPKNFTVYQNISEPHIRKNFVNMADLAVHYHGERPPQSVRWPPRPPGCLLHRVAEREVAAGTCVTRSQANLLVVRVPTLKSILSRDGETVKIVEWLVCGNRGGWDNHKAFSSDLREFTLKFSRGEACDLNMGLLCQAHPECEEVPFRCLGKPYCQRDRFTFDPETNRLVLTLSNARESGELVVPVTRRIRHDMLLFCVQLANAVPLVPPWIGRTQDGSEQWRSSDPIRELETAARGEAKTGMLPVYTQ
ncbi:hypothetical protein HDV00_008775 [Rhizophlyctis rosea]|nr:hypothetical protein HDV00_008775 [Rhizophlyctis rosea]